MAKDGVGIVFVYNQENPNHDSQLEIWFDIYFIFILTFIFIEAYNDLIFT